MRSAAPDGGRDPSHRGVGIRQLHDADPLPWPVRLRRAANVAWMVVAVYVPYKLRQIRGALFGGREREDFYDAQHERAARRILATAVHLEGLLIKVCQFLGSRADVLPPAFIEILAELQDRVPPRPFADIGPWIEDQLGRPLSECFADFETVPVASASLAQVHRARLHDGRRVAVKVQYPGIRRVVATDMAAFGFFVNLLARIEPMFDLRLMLREVRRLVPAELDFVHEAGHARRFAADFADDPRVVFPEPIEEFSCRTVLVMSFCEGIKVNDVAALAAAGIDKHAVAELLSDAYIRQILVHGFFHGDPHPGNLLVQPGPRLVILDLGLAKEFTPELRAGLVELTLAIVAEDAQAIGRSFRTLGFETKTGSDDTFIALGHLLLGQALKAGQAYADLTMVERIQEQLVTALRANPLVRASSDLLLVLRVMGLLSGIGKQLDSQVDPLAAMMPYLMATSSNPDPASGPTAVTPPAGPTGPAA